MGWKIFGRMWNYFLPHSSFCYHSISFLSKQQKISHSISLRFLPLLKYVCYIRPGQFKIHLFWQDGIDSWSFKLYNFLEFHIFWMMRFILLSEQVRYLKIIEKSGYQALPWVRYITMAGEYELRLIWNQPLLCWVFCQ